MSKLIAAWGINAFLTSRKSNITHSDNSGNYLFSFFKKSALKTSKRDTGSAYQREPPEEAQSFTN